MIRLPNLKIPRWILWTIAAPGVLGPMLIFAFIYRTERAHEESRCPYRQVEQRSVTEEIRVSEEMRDCLPNVEERRYTVIRPDRSRTLGKRRFSSDAFSEGYRWQAELGDDGQVRVHVYNPGQDKATFREGPADGMTFE